MNRTAAPTERDHLSRSFDRALDSLWMAYQPIVRADDGSLFGHEALVRTRDRLLAKPVALFAAAEHLERTGALGVAIRSAILRSHPPSPPGGALFVNTNLDDLADDGLTGFLEAMAAGGTSVVLEVSEQSTHDGLRGVLPRLAALRRRGFRVALDDLGAGWAGLARFASLEPEIVKIDRSLVQDIHRAPIKQRVVSSLIELCRGLGILVVAEGIETAAERATVTALGCALLQGYAIGRPAPFDPRVLVDRCGLPVDGLAHPLLARA